MTLPDTDPSAAATPDDTLFTHRALCGLALPAGPPDGPDWAREAGNVGLAMGAEAAPMPLPGGPALRLLLLHVLTRAMRSEDAAVPVAEDAGAMARDLGLRPDHPAVAAMAEQWPRVPGARLSGRSCTRSTG